MNCRRIAIATESLNTSGGVGVYVLRVAAALHVAGIARVNELARRRSAGVA
jgi:hypothetical protein